MACHEKFGSYWHHLEARIPEAGIALGLDRMTTSLNQLGRPEQHFQIVLVAGTNGKGSTCRFTEQLLLKQGKRVGCFSSPHIFSPCERIRLNGENIAEDILVATLKKNEEQFPDLTYFELFTISATQLFLDQDVEIAIFEIGLGGRLDASNALHHVMATAITSIGLDHTHILGDTMAEIAREKSGIMRAGVPLVLGDMPIEAATEIQRGAKRMNVTCVPVNKDGENCSGVSELIPRYLLRNLSIACEVVRQLVPSLPELSTETIEDLLLHRPFGRWSVVKTGPLKVIDGAHNPEGVRAVLAHLDTTVAGDVQIEFFFAAAATKDLATIVPLLARENSVVHAVAYGGDRWHAPEDVLDLVAPQQRGNIYTVEEAKAHFSNGDSAAIWLGSLRGLEVFKNDAINKF